MGRSSTREWEKIMTMRARSMSLGAWLLAGCASGTAYRSPPPPPPLVPDPVATELPTHHFYARETSGSVYPVFERVAFTSLPAMVQSRKCVDAGAVAEGRPGLASDPLVSKPSKKKKGGSVPGHVRYAGTTTGATPTTPTASPSAEPTELAKHEAAPRAAEPASEAESTDDFDGGTRLEGGASVGAGGMTQGPPPADAKVAVTKSSGESKAAKRDARRARREAKRGPDKALATSSSPPAMEEAPATTAIAVEPLLVFPPPEEGWGAATFLSNDDSMSLSSAQRVLFAIDQHLPLPPQHVRPHELLNYFSFETSPVPEGHDFAVRAELAPSRREPGLQALGLAIAGRPVGREGRRNAALTLVVDRSGSMKEEGRMEFLKRGLLRMVRELKDGDIVHVVTFDHRVCNPLRNFVVGRDDLSVLTDTIHAIKPEGRTNVHAGLNLGYQLADASYQPKHTNRVLLITDALANTGVTDAHTIAMISDWYDARRIRLSGVGVGREFDDALLDRLTEKGRGAYVFLGSEAEVDAVFGERFTSLVETVANDVHFRLHLPPALRMQAFHGEEASTVKQEVQPVHFFADTSQLLLAELEPWQGVVRPQDDLMLEIEYQHPDSGETRVEDHVFNVGQIGGESGGEPGSEPGSEPSQTARNVRKAEVIMHFVEAIERQAHRGAPAGWQARPGAWQDAAALDDCAQTRAELRDLAAGSQDPEVARVLSLWDGYCVRFEGSAAGRPGRKAEGGWPAARR
jgi:Ca-activated chloride channel homolog